MMALGDTSATLRKSGGFVRNFRWFGWIEKLTPARTPVSVVPKLCFAILINPPDSGFASNGEIRQAELGMTHSQAELGNDIMEIGKLFWRGGVIRI